MATKRFLSDKNETLVVRFLIALALYFLIRSMIKRAAKEQTQNAVLSGDANALYATELRQAMNPTGVSWMMSFDLTDKEAIFNIARKITDFKAVANNYANLYDSDLLTDLQEELNATDFAQFQALLGKGGAIGRYFAKVATTSFEVNNYNPDQNQVGTIGSVLKTYKQAELIDAQFVEVLGKGSAGTEYVLFKDSKFYFIDEYFVIRASDLILR